jgi:hypothetical protein
MHTWIIGALIWFAIAIPLAIGFCAMAQHNSEG